MSVVIESVSEYELERGKSMPSLLHSVLQSNLIRLLSATYHQTYLILPELSIATPDDKPLVPDIAIYPRFEIDWKNDILRQPEAPLATIEILSPKQNLSELNDKAQRYFDLGVTSCWIVLTSMDAIAVNHQEGKYTFFTKDETLVDDKIGVKLPLEEVFK